MTEAIHRSPEFQSPETFRDFVDRNPVYLVSADLPGTGSSSLVRQIAERLDGVLADSRGDGTETHVMSIGEALRQKLGVTNDAEMNAALSRIPDPKEFDRTLYGDLPDDRPCVVDGKLATAAGPQFLTGDRPIVAIDLTSQPLVSTRRILRRQRYTFDEFFRPGDGGQNLLAQLALVNGRASHDNGMRDDINAGVDYGERVQRFTADTSRYSIQELVEMFTEGGDFRNHVPDWELDAITETMRSLSHVHLGVEPNVHRNDLAHFRHQFDTIRYERDRLSVMRHPEAIAKVRANLKDAIVDCWSGLMMKEAPRFFSDTSGTPVLDTESQRWTPEFYKIAEAWPVLSTVLKDKDILDPFAGPGTLMNLLAARDIPSSIRMSDIAYEGGRPINNQGHTYLPELNRQMFELLFDDLPSWYKPNFGTILEYKTASAQQLPFEDDSVDYIVADPPYGKNHDSGGVGLLVGSMREFGRVARMGSLLMLPMPFIREVEQAGHEVTRLTGDLSRGQSGYPVAYVSVEADKTGR